MKKAMNEAWRILKEMPSCQVCQGPLEKGPGGEGMVCYNANCPAVMMLQTPNQPVRRRFDGPYTGPADYSRDMYS